MESKNIKKLPDREIKQLVKQFQAGDNKSFEQLFIAYEGYLKFFVKKYKNLINLDKYGIDSSDLFSVAYQALLLAAKKYKPVKNAAFSTFFYVVANNKFFIYKKKLESKGVNKFYINESQFRKELDDFVSLDELVDNKRYNELLLFAQDEQDKKFIIKKAEKVMKPSEYYIFLRVAVNNEISSEIASEFKVSRQMISQLLRNGCKKVEKALTDKNFLKY